MKRIAKEHTYEQVVQAEIAHEILNTARSIILSHVYKIRTADPAEAERLLEKSREIHDLQRSFDVTDDMVIADIIAIWRVRIKDADLFLKGL